MNRCHYIDENFNYCNRRRMATQNYCFEHHSESLLPMRNLTASRNAPYPEYRPLPENSSDLEHRQAENSNNQEEIDESEPQPNNNDLPPLIEEVLPIPVIPPLLIRENAVVLDNEEEDPILNAMSSLTEVIRRRAISSRNRRSSVPFRLPEPRVEENPENSLCLLCENYVVKPWVELKCNHRYHLNCFIIDNSNEKTFELKKNCNKCNKKITFEQEEYQCAICLEKIIDHKVLSNLPCEHKFHLLCIEQWKVMNKNTCPLCRTRID